MEQDWINGGKQSVYSILGSSNHSDTDRSEYDFYATTPIATRCLCGLETFSDNIWEPACGMNHITNVLKDHGYNVRYSDVVDRIKDGNIEIIDFLKYKSDWDGDIITNPPYKYAQEFVEKSMDIIKDGHKVAMFLKLTFLEGKKRKELFQKYPPKVIYVSSSRLGCAPNGDFTKGENPTSAVCYSWFIWEKGYKGNPIIKWFN